MAVAEIVGRADQRAADASRSFGRFNEVGQCHCGRSPRPRTRAGLVRRAADRAPDLVCNVMARA